MALPAVNGEFLVISNEPTLNFTQSGTAVLKVRVAAKSRKKDPNNQGQWIDDKNFIGTLEMWGEDAERYAPLLTKLTLLSISNGNISINEYTTQQNEKRQDVVIGVSFGSVGILPPKPQNGQQGQQGGQQQGGYGQGQQGGYNQQGQQGEPQGGYPGQPGPTAGYPPHTQQGQQGQPPVAPQQTDPWGTPMGGQPPF